MIARLRKFACADILSRVTQLCSMEQLDEAIDAVEIWCNRDVALPKDVILCLLQVSAKKRDLETGRRIHCLIIKMQLDSVLVLIDQLIRLFTSCGSLPEANHVFGQCKRPTVYTWHAIISAHATLGENYTAFQLFCYMQQQGNVSANSYIFSCILKVCSRMGDGKLFHHAIISLRLETDVCIGTSLMHMYVRCGSIEDAYSVFEKQYNKNVISWGTLIAGCTEYGNTCMAFQLFGNMHSMGLEPDRVIFLCMSRACGHARYYLGGKLIHAMVIELKLDIETTIKNSLIDMYAKCGSFEDSRNIFKKIKHRDEVSWGAFIAGQALNGDINVAFHLFEAMQAQGIKPNKVIMLNLLKACGDGKNLIRIRSTHDTIVRSGFESEQVVGNALVDVYAKCGSLCEACAVFDSLRHRDVVSWSAMMVGSIPYGLMTDVLHLFVKMEEAGVKPDAVTFSCALKACTSMGAVHEGKLLHDQIVKSGYDANAVIVNALLNMYIKCKHMEEAHQIFGIYTDHDSIAWATMLGGYADEGCHANALDLFVRRQPQCVSKVGFLSVLKACSNSETVRETMIIHDQVIKASFEADAPVTNSLMAAYTKLGTLQEAHKVFDQSSDVTLVSWGVMITGYEQQGHDIIALQIYEKMRQRKVEANHVIFLSVLKACTNIGAAEKGKAIHEQAIKSGLESSDVQIGNVLLDMYAKFGNLDDAYRIFVQLPNRTEGTWAAIITAYATHGQFMMVERLLSDMQKEGLQPNGSIFTGILIACSHTGMVAEGCSYFSSMLREYSITPGAKHYTCTIDLLARAGFLLEAKDFLHSMPVLSDVSGWMSLLISCLLHGNRELARRCFCELLQLDPVYNPVCMLSSKSFDNSNLSCDVHVLENCLVGITERMETNTQKFCTAHAHNSRDYIDHSLDKWQWAFHDGLSSEHIENECVGTISPTLHLDPLNREK